MQETEFAQFKTEPDAKKCRDVMLKQGFKAKNLVVRAVVVDNKWTRSGEASPNRWVLLYVGRMTQKTMNALGMAWQVYRHAKKGRKQAKPAHKKSTTKPRKRKPTKAKQQNPMGDVGAMMGDVNKTVMTGMGTIMGVKLAGAVIKMIPGGK